MPVYLSPGVYTVEKDLSAFASDGSDVVPAFIGTAKKGPINSPKLITSAQQFVETFGEPFTESYLGYAVLAFLEEGNICYVNRVGVECEDGQDAALADVCIDTSGSQTTGWGRIALFTGVDYGKICTHVISADTPLSFHAASTSTPVFTDVEESDTYGASDATLTLSGSYVDAIDDSFIVVLTGAPTGSNMIAGATYDIIRNSDDEIISTGTLTEASPGVSDSFDIGTGANDTGLAGVINTQTGSAPLNVGDYFVFSAAPDNRSFAFSVDGDVPDTVSFGTATYTDPDTFVTAFNALAGSSESYIAVAQDDDSVCIRTDTAGRWIQLVSTEAFALEIGVQLWAYDIPRSYVLATDVGPYNINSTNNRVKVRVITETGNVETEVSLTTNSAHTAASLVAELDAAGTIDGTTYFNALVLRISDTRTVPILITTTSNQTDNLRLLASATNSKTLRFAQELGVNVPYGTDYTVFFDSRVILPDAGVTTPSTPLSCEVSALSDECALDTAYYAGIVGFIVAESPGTWANDYTVTLELFNNNTGRYTVKIRDDDNVVVERLDDVSFDPREDRYIANIVNAGSSLGGTNGNKYIRWEERPSYLGNDVTDLSTFEVRNPGTFTRAFSGGANGIPTDAVYSSEVDAAILGNAVDSTGIFAFQNPERYEIDLLVTPGVSTGTVIGQALQMCEGRGDCFYLVDPPFGLRPQQVIDWHNGLLDSTVTAAINSSYGALYWSWLKVFDQFGRQEIFIPPSGHTSAVYARTARVGEIWQAPAGLNRGKLLTALDVEFNPSQAERDALYGYGNAVNPITKFPQDGIVVFGQRTLQRADTALNRVNVRMLMNHLKRKLVRLLRNYVFEPNDEILWSTIKANIDPFLRDIGARRGITAYKVVVDGTNNTPEVIDRNELRVSVLVKPTRAAEFIELTVAVLRTDQSFSASEVLIAGGVQLGS